MNSFNKSNKFGKRDSGRSDRRDSGRSDRREMGPSSYRSEGRFDRQGSTGGRSSVLEMHEVICDKCGKTCEVPFKPTSNKPVYCRTCFKQNNPYESNSFKPRNRDNFEPKTNQSNVSHEELDKINEKLNKIMKALKIE